MKKLVTLAVAAAFTAPVMADTTLYGKVRLYVGNSVADTAGAESETGVSGAGSRLGLKGSTALANGMTAKFQTEYDTGALIDGGASLKARNNWVGLDTKYGEVRAGYMSTPLDMVDDPLDIFHVNGSGTAFGNRASGLTYINKLGPVGVAVAALPNRNGANSGDGVSAMANIKRGPIYFGVGVDNNNGDNSQRNIDGSSKQALITAAYTLGNKAVVGLSSYAKEDDENNDGDIQDSEKTSNLAVTGKYPMGRAYIAGSYGIGASEDDAVEDSTKMLAEVGYKLGKATTVFASAYNDEQDGTDSGEGVGIGVNHNF